MSELSDVQREVLSAVCDTVVPAVEHEPDPDGFFARTADATSACDLAHRAGSWRRCRPSSRPGSPSCSTRSPQQGFVRASRRSREQLLRNIALFGPDAAAGVGALIVLDAVLLLRPARRARPEPELGDVRLPRPGQRAAAAREAAPAARSRRRHDARGRRLHRRLGRRRRRDGRRAVRPRAEGRRAGDGRLLRRRRLQPARAVGLPEPVLARRSARRPPI